MPATHPPDVAAPGEFDELYAAHFTSVTVQLYAFVGNLAEAQDLTQEAFCRAWQRWSTVRDHDDPVAWVRKVAWRLAVSRWRRVRTAVAYVRNQRIEVVPALDGLRIDLVRALATLPPDQRRAVVLHHLVGLSTVEIAADMDVAQGTVRSWLSRGRTALRAQLDLPDEDSCDTMKEVP